jgi:hypothetical protein
MEWKLRTSKRSFRSGLWCGLCAKCDAWHVLWPLCKMWRVTRVVASAKCDARHVLWPLCKMWRATRVMASVQNATRDTCYGLCAKCDAWHVLWPLCKIWRVKRAVACVQNVTRDTCCGLCAKCDARHLLWPLCKMWRATRAVASVQNVKRDTCCGLCKISQLLLTAVLLNLQMKIIIISSVYKWFTDMQILTWSLAVWNSVNKAVGVLWALMLVKGLRCQVRRLWESRRL